MNNKQFEADMSVVLDLALKAGGAQALGPVNRIMNRFNTQVDPEEDVRKEEGTKEKVAKKEN